jgi:hypothetical protein
MPYCTTYPNGDGLKIVPPACVHSVVEAATNICSTAPAFVVSWQR